MSESPALEFLGVGFSYGGAPVLEDVNLRVGARELVSVVGPNGGGKTTLLKLALGLLHPSQGRVLAFGERPERSRRRIGYAPQRLEFDRSFPITALETALLGRTGRSGVRGWLGWPDRSDRSAALAALERVGIADQAGRPLASLSGGQLQRVMIARALAGSPELLLLDEPTANVDAETEVRLTELIRDLNRSIAVVMVSHDPLFVSNMVEHVVCVNRSVVSHPTGKFEDPTVARLYGQESLRIVHHDRICDDRDHRHD